MVVRIRLSRFGCKNRPFYRVMAADSRSPRDGKHLEVLGYYNPLPGALLSTYLSSTCPFFSFFLFIVVEFYHPGFLYFVVSNLGVVCFSAPFSQFCEFGLCDFICTGVKF